MTAGEPVFVLRTEPEGLGDAAEGFTGRDAGTPRVGIRSANAKQLYRQQSPSRSRSPRNLPLRRLASTGSAVGASMSSSPSLAHSTTITIGPPSPAASSASPSRGKNFPRATLGGGLGGRNSPSAGRRPFSATAAPGSSPKPPLSPSAAAPGGNPLGEWELMWRDAVTRTESTARGLVGPLQRGAEEIPARIQRGVVDGAVAIGGVANAVKVRAQATAKAAFGLLDRLDGDRLHCPRCKGSGLLSPSQAWSRLLRPAPAATNEPCWFCQGIGVMPIFDLSGFLVARCPPLVSSRHASSATLRFSSFQLFLGKFPGTRTRLVTSRLPRMLRHAIFAPALGPFCNASQDEAVRAFCSRGDPIWGALSSPLRPGTPDTARAPGSPHTSGATTPMAAPGALQSSTAGGAGAGAGDGSGFDEELATGGGEFWGAGAGGEIGQQSPRSSRSPRRERNKVREKAERQAVERARVMQRSSSARGGSAGIGETAEALEGDAQGGANDLWWIVGARIRAAGSSFAPSMDFPSSHTTSFSLVPSTPRATQVSNTDSKKPTE
ncbi:unnamed protein product [Closterium sp. Yama58-4]|nr:unnamed protein product [Closterium sp. Yama58-4]